MKTFALVLLCVAALWTGMVHADNATPFASEESDGPPVESRPAIAAKLEKLYAVEESPEYSGNERVDAIVHAYEELFAGSQRVNDLSPLADTDLQILFRAAYTAAFYSGEPAHALEVIRLFGELKDRGRADKSHRADLYRALVGARMFDRARALQHTHTADGLEVLPEIRTAPRLAGPSSWRVDAEARLLVEEPVDLHMPATIVVVSHPGCRFSQAAVAAIESDPVLGPVFARHAQWLVPRGPRIDFDLMQQWNREHPDAAVSLAVERGDWPMIDRWNTPTFYFFENGRLSAQVRGWPLDGAGRREEVVEALQAMDLLKQVESTPGKPITRSTRS